jgi:hypothetical protein
MAFSVAIPRASDQHLCPQKGNQTYNTSVVLEVQENTVGSSPWLWLSDDNSWHDLLSQLRLSLLDGSHNHISDTPSWQTVKTRTDTLNGNDVEISGSAVVAAVHDGTTVNLLVSQAAFDKPFRLGFAVRSLRNVHWKTEGHLKFATWGTTTIRTEMSVYYSSSMFLGLQTRLSFIWHPESSKAYPQSREVGWASQAANIGRMRGDWYGRTYESFAISSYDIRPCEVVKDGDAFWRGKCRSVDVVAKIERLEIWSGNPNQLSERTNIGQFSDRNVELYFFTTSLAINGNIGKFNWNGKTEIMANYMNNCAWC